MSSMRIAALLLWAAACLPVSTALLQACYDILLNCETQRVTAILDGNGKCITTPIYVNCLAGSINAINCLELSYLYYMKKINEEIAHVEKDCASTTLPNQFDFSPCQQAKATCGGYTRNAYFLEQNSRDPCSNLITLAECVDNIKAVCSDEVAHLDQLLDQAYTVYDYNFYCPGTTTAKPSTTTSTTTITTTTTTAITTTPTPDVTQDPGISGHINNNGNDNINNSDGHKTGGKLEESEKMAFLRKLLTAQQLMGPEDEWHAFCTSVGYDLRKLTDPFLKLKVKRDIGKIVYDAVLQQLKQNVLPPANTPTFTR